MTHSISLIAPAKLNLNLSIKEKLKNGYNSEIMAWVCLGQFGHN